VLGYVVNGLAAGGGYALAGVGLSFTIGVARVLNFAFGSFYMLGAYLVAYMTGNAVGLGYLLAVFAMLAGVLVIAYAFGRGVVLPVAHRSEAAVMIATLAASLFITNIALQLFGSDVTFIRSPFEDHVYHVGDARVSQQAIIALIAAPLVTVALVAFLRHTLLGARIRATAQNPQLAGATGINVSSVFLTAVVIGTMLAALAGALYGPTTVIDVFGGDGMLLKAFTVAALAGMGKLWGGDDRRRGDGHRGERLQRVRDALVRRGVHLRAAGPDAAVLPAGRVPRAMTPTMTTAEPKASPATSARPRRRWTLAWVVAAPTLLWLVMLAVDDSTSSILQLAAVVAALAVSFQIVYGLLGELSLGHAALFGVGAYAYASLASRHQPIVLAVVAAGVLGLLAGAAVAAVTVRLGHAYFAVATFAVASLGAVAVSSSGPLGREQGIIGVPAFPGLPGLSQPQTQLIYTGGVLLLCLACLALFRRTRAGLALETVRADAALARALGVDVALARIVATGLSGLLAGIVGAVFAQQARYVSPDVFGLYYIVTPLAVIVVGGLRWTAGAVVGAVVVVVVPQLVGLSPIANQIFAAVVLFAVVVLAPEGVAGALARIGRRERALPTSLGVAAPPDAPPGEPGEVVLKADGVTVRFGALTAAADVSLELRAGEVLGLIGANGAGKSTFVNAVSGLAPLAGGRVWVGGTELTKRRAHVRVRHGLARTFQQVLIAEDLTTRQNLAVAASQGRFFRTRASGQAIERAAADCGLTPLLDVHASALSFMDRRLLSIAMALAPEPAVVLLDEATAGLSEQERVSVRQLVRGVAGTRGTAFIVIEHDVAFVTEVSDRMAVMNHGRLIVEGPSGVVLADPEVVTSYLGTA